MGHNEPILTIQDGWCVDYPNHPCPSTYLKTNKCLTYLPTYIIIAYIPYLLNYDTSPFMDVGTLGVGFGKLKGL